MSSFFSFFLGFILIDCMLYLLFLDLILYLRSEEEHALYFKIEVLMITSSMITRLISRLLCSILIHEYILI